MSHFGSMYTNYMPYSPQQDKAEINSKYAGVVWFLRGQLRTGFFNNNNVHSNNDTSI